jgi:hypothetical protein
MKERDKIPADEITAPEVYFNRRIFMRAGIQVHRQNFPGRDPAAHDVEPAGASLRGHVRRQGAQSRPDATHRSSSIERPLGGPRREMFVVRTIVASH